MKLRNLKAAKNLWRQLQQKRSSPARALQLLLERLARRQLLRKLNKLQKKKWRRPAVSVNMWAAHSVSIKQVKYSQKMWLVFCCRQCVYKTWEQIEMQTVFHVFNFLDVHFNSELAYYDVLFEMLRVNSFWKVLNPFPLLPFPVHCK